VLKKNNFRKIWKTLTEQDQELGVLAAKFGNLVEMATLTFCKGFPTSV
jgi:hypothetical protein